jgi:hypothetical protein
MQINITTKQILNLLLVLAWVIFVGLSIEAGSFLTNIIFTLVNPGVVPRLWHQVDMPELFRYDRGYFIVVLLIFCIVSTVKAWLFYLIIRLLHNKNVNVAQSFSSVVQRFILQITFVSVLIGFFSIFGVRYIEWLSAQGVKMPNAIYLQISGGDVWLFMAVVLYVIAQVYKRGVEIQSDNDLTI